ncbi:serine/threonine-protein phosphatase 6 regulatory ankyrin repeat subunit B-like [Corticium candelabrum]|uniref:serine/threonine-protein phosphatase 6 regulatory ankyrin repeat subunit B-like n=1 Tax=Corticium candelabrum TaxID=121492 RepID=UPI002E26660D|nr:serine/threonine-protein phosphatase 6 regulatory ankyrin repeat subunit B-like [Corticium candelabrum]
MERNVATAARDGDWEEVRRLVEEGGNVNDVDTKSNSTALHWAAENENSGICSFLLSRGAKINLKDKDGQTPLHLAAAKHHFRTCQLLVHVYKADVASVNNCGQTPLHKALIKSLRDIPALYLPLITNESVNVADRLGNCALHIAARNGDIQTVQLLVDCGADVNALNEDGQTPLHTAAGGEKDCPELCSILLEHNAKIDAVDKDGNQPLHLAVRKGHTRTSRLLLSSEADVNSLNEDGQTPLHAAKHNAKIDAVDKDGNQPLHLAEHNAKIDAVDKDGNQPLHLAVRKGHTRTSRLLLSSEADVNSLNEDGQTPLHAAACKCFKQQEIQTLAFGKPTIDVQW